MSTTSSLPPLVGQPWQVAKAEKKRATLLSSEGHHPSTQYIPDAMIPVLGGEVAKMPTDATWWLNSRENKGFYSLFLSRFGLPDNENTQYCYQAVEDHYLHVMQQRDMKKHYPDHECPPENVLDDDGSLSAYLGKEKAREVAEAFGLIFQEEA